MGSTNSSVSVAQPDRELSSSWNMGKCGGVGGCATWINVIKNDNL
jgi:hypothetical protein